MTALVRPRIALCHEWLTTLGGSERVSSRIASVLDVTEVFTFAADRALAQRVFGRRPVHTSRLGSSGFATKHWSWLLPLMSRWWSSLDLDAYDAVVTCSHSTVNSIRTRPDAVHISYCCTPMRYAWAWRGEIGRLPAALRPGWPAAAALLRRGDRRRAAHVDLFLAVSSNVATRIQQFYGRPALVVYPPVDTDYFTPIDGASRDDFFLVAGRLVTYKRADVAVRAATQRGVRLIVAGAGPELARLQRIAGPTVDFIEQPSTETLRELYRRAKALVYPGSEDFGIVPVEAQSCGTPVIALAEGGAIETVIDGVTGKLYKDASVDGLADELASFEEDRYDRDVIRDAALRFRRERFDEALRRLAARIFDPKRPFAQVISELLADGGADQ